MASRRMFSLRIISTARFLKMPISSQALYFHLGMHADDDGVVEAYPIIKTVGCTEDDLRVLCAKGFVQVLNEDLVSYIADWQENNKIRADRKIDSIYKDLLLQVNPDVKLLEKKAVTDKCQSNDGQMSDTCQTNVGIGKDRLGKDRLGQDRLGKVRSGKVKKPDFAPLIDDSNLSSPVKEKLMEFVSYRTEMRKPYKSERGMRSLIGQVEKQEQMHGSSAVIGCIEESMSNGWQGIFWDRIGKTPARKAYDREAQAEYARRMDALDEQNRNAEDSGIFV